MPAFEVAESWLPATVDASPRRSAFVGRGHELELLSRCVRERREVKKAGSKKFRVVSDRAYKRNEYQRLLILLGILAVLGLIILLRSKGFIGSHHAAPAGDLSLALDMAAPRLRGRRDPLKRSETSARRLTTGHVSLSRAPSASAPASRGAHRATPDALPCRNHPVASRTSPCHLLWGLRDSHRARS